MRKKITIALFYTIIPFFATGAQDMAVATVRLEKTEPVFGKQLEQSIAIIEEQQGRKLDKDEKRKVLEQLVSQTLVVQAAEADLSVSIKDEDVKKASIGFVSQQLQAIGAIPAGAVLTDELQYKEMIERQGITVDEYEKNVRKQLLIERYITTKNQAAFQSIKEPTDKEIEGEYQRRISEFVVPDTVWFNHIFFSTHNADTGKKDDKLKKALAVYRRLINTSDTFAELVSAESEDEISRAKGGTVGPLRKGDNINEQLYGSKFIDKIFDMRVGDVSNVIESNAGYHIVKVTEKKTAQLLTKDDPEVRQYLGRLLYAKKYQQTFDRISEDIISELKKKATIKYFGEYK